MGVRFELQAPRIRLAIQAHTRCCSLLGESNWPPAAAIGQHAAFAQRPTHCPSLGCGSAPLSSANPWARSVAASWFKRTPSAAARIASGRCRQALGDALHELAAVVLGAGNAPLSCCSAATHALKASYASAMAASTVSPSATQPGRSGTVARKPPPPSREAARCGWRSAAISTCYLNGQADFMASLVPQTVTSATS